MITVYYIDKKSENVNFQNKHNAKYVTYKY